MGEIIPVADRDPSNPVAAGRNCNRRKGRKLVQEWQA